MMQKSKASGLHEDSADFSKFNIEEILLQEVGSPQPPLFLNSNLIYLNRVSNSVTPRKPSEDGSHLRPMTTVTSTPSALLNG